MRGGRYIHETGPVAVGLRNYEPVFASLIVILTGAAGLLLFGGSRLIVYGDMLPKAPEPKLPNESPSLTAAPATTALPPARKFDSSVASVAEGTTRSLESVPTKCQRIHPG